MINKNILIALFVFMGSIDAWSCYATTLSPCKEEPENEEEELETQEKKSKNLEKLATESDQSNQLKQEPTLSFWPTTESVVNILKNTLTNQYISISYSQQEEAHTSESKQDNTKQKACTQISHVTCQEKKNKLKKNQKMLIKQLEMKKEIIEKQDELCELLTNEYNSKLESANEKIEQQQKLLEINTEELRKRGQRIKKLQTLQEKKIEIVKDLEGQLNQFKVEVESLHGKVSNLHSQLSDAEELSESLEQKNNYLTNENKELKSALEESQTNSEEISKKGATIEKLEGQLIHMKHELLEKKYATDQSIQQNNQLHIELEILQGKIDDLDSQLTDAKELSESLEQKNDNLTNENKELKSAWEESQTNSEEVSKKEATIEKLEGKIIQIENELLQTKLTDHKNMQKNRQLDPISKEKLTLSHLHDEYLILKFKYDQLQNDSKKKWNSQQVTGIFLVSIISTLCITYFFAKKQAKSKNLLKLSQQSIIEKSV